MSSDSSRATTRASRHGSFDRFGVRGRSSVYRRDLPLDEPPERDARRRDPRLARNALRVSSLT